MHYCSMRVMQTEVIQFLCADLVKGQIGKEVLTKCSNNQSWYINIWGSDKVTYSVSGSHLDQEGIIMVTSLGLREHNEYP
jgi:hypothetical protein